jgi:hypothetical protein
VITPDDIRQLIFSSIEMLKPMQLSNSLFCFDRIKGQLHPRGLSVRYTLITLLGLLNAEKNGYRTGFDIQEIFMNLLLNLDSKEITAGDYGLYLWVDSELGVSNHAKLTGKLISRFQTSEDYTGCLAMELAWVIVGALKSLEKSGDSCSQTVMNQALHCFIENYISTSGLFRHYGDLKFRGRFPNFATQIYGILALCAASKYTNDPQFLSIARTTADRLLLLQMPDGGWPWLYDTETGTIVEQYEVYSVHQDGMAPMCLFELSKLTNDVKYSLAALHGMNWLYGNNEMNFNMIDHGESLIYRSIRRKRPFDRLMLYVNTALSQMKFKSNNGLGYFLEINPTCRPYHLGWMLYAWCGNENLAMMNNK